MGEPRRLAEKVGDVSIEPAPEDYEGEWCVAVTFPFAGKGMQTRDLADYFPTPGAALDAAIKWAKDRGLECQWMAHRFHLIRPGVSEEDTTNGPE